MFHLVSDFGNTNIFEMIWEFIKSLPEFLWWLLNAVVSNLYWVIPAVLAVLLIIWVKLYLEIFKERKAFLTEVARSGAEIKTTALKTLFSKSGNPDVFVNLPSGKCLAVKFFPSKKKRSYIHFFSSEHCILSKNSFTINGKEVIELGGEGKSDEISTQLASSTHSDKIDLKFEASEGEYEKVFVLIPSASRITYVKHSGDTVELRDGDSVFGIRVFNKGTFMRYIDKNERPSK